MPRITLSSFRLASSLSVLFLAYFASGIHFPAEAETESKTATKTTQARLWFFNGSAEKVEISWLKSPQERVAQETLDPGKETVITTTLGHRFILIGEESAHEMTVESLVPVQGARFDPTAKDGIPAFYSQRKDVGGYPIVASATVNPYALEEAAFIIQEMLSERDDLLTAMAKSGAHLSIFAYNEFTTDLPEFAHFAHFPKQRAAGIDNKEFWDARARGTGGSISDPFCSCGEENLLAFAGDPYAAESIMVHEFAHNVHLRGMTNLDSTFDDRLKKAYQKAMAKGLWKDKYAATNHFEYFAEGVQSWFGNNRENDHDHNHVNTRKELIEYDPVLANFCREVFGDSSFVYTKPDTRLTGHLEGYDPKKSPTFEWPERLLKAKAEIRRMAQEADQPKAEEK